MYKRIVRKDGLVILLVPKKDSRSVTFEVLYKVGSRQENLKNNGASHFVEHLMFKGTERRPDTATISKELDSIGAEYNAFTGKDHTGYYIKSNSSNIVLSVDMLSDMINNSKFDKDDIDRERGVIIEEINMYEDNPLMYIEDVFESLIYDGTKLGYNIAGPRKNIQDISRSSLYSYYKKFYYNSNCIIGIAGKFNEEKVLKLVDQLFPIVKKEKKVKINKVKSFKQTKPKVEIIKRNNVEQVQLILGFRNVSSKDKRFLATQVLANILGGTMSSRLFLEIREKRGLCYFIKSSIHGYEDISSFAVHAGLNKEKIYTAIELIKEELNKIKNKGVSKEELEKAKNNIKGRFTLKMENVVNHLNFLAGQELFDEKIKDLDERLKEVEKLTLKQINDIAKEIIDWKKVNLAVIGPFNNKNKFIKILTK